MTEYTLSIIIPHYNIPELLEKLLDSIPARDDIQIVVVDDNSTKKQEELMALVENNSNRNFEFYKNYTGKNSAGICRNIGLEHAEGKWIMFADSDDYYVDGWLEKLEPFFESDNQIIYFRPTSKNIDTGEIDTRHCLTADAVHNYCKEPNRKNELQLKYFFTAACTMLCRHSFLIENDLKFGDTMRAEDTYFVVQCANKVEKFDCLDEDIYCITRRNGSITTKTDMKLFDEHMRVKIWKYGLMFRSLDTFDIPLVELEYAGLKIWREAISSKCSLKMMREYRRLMKKEGVPLIYWKHFSIITLVKQAVRAL